MTLMKMMMTTITIFSHLLVYLKTCPWPQIQPKTSFSMEEKKRCKAIHAPQIQHARERAVLHYLSRLTMLDGRLRYVHCVILVALLRAPSH